MSDFKQGDKVKTTMRIFTNPTIPPGATCKVIGIKHRIGRVYLCIEGPVGQKAMHQANLFEKVA